MDGGSGLNIMYTKTLDAMGIDRARIRPTRAPFHGIMPGKQAIPISRLTYPSPSGIHPTIGQRPSPLRYLGSPVYHAILEQPCYAKFMAIPNYTFLKLKMSGPHGVITIGSSFERAYECEVESCELTSATLASEELAAIGKDITKGAPDAKQVAKTFEPMENVKEVLVDLDNSTNKMVCIGTSLSPK
ncbi:uncharacterized protein [Miscanthus floridulus]|uniref:uncharacterized protein n=1 Tax=Miscanthus floridulus TaxID=154761 RepID=UPI003458BE97